MAKTFYLEGVPEDVWERWTNSFPRSQSINDRLVELIEADAPED